MNEIFPRRGLDVELAAAADSARRGDIAVLIYQDYLQPLRVYPAERPSRPVEAAAEPSERGAIAGSFFRRRIY